MSDSFVQLPPDSSGKSVDASSLNVGASTVQRQRIIIADNTGTSSYATCMGSNPVGTEGALVVRNIPSGTQPVSGTISLGASTANIGTINNISAPANCLIGLSSPALGSNGAAKAIWGDGYGRQVIIQNHPSLYNTASHGPKCVTLSTSAAVALIAAPGAGLCVYITKIASANGSSLYMAASGGGFVMDYNPPIKTLSNTAVNARVKPSVSKCMFNVHFYVGPK